MYMWEVCVLCGYMASCYDTCMASWPVRTHCASTLDLHTAVWFCFGVATAVRLAAAQRGRCEGVHTPLQAGGKVVPP